MALGEDVNPMLPGNKLYCIFGFCDIRNFTDATEVLQEGVMLFVNEIGEIVHTIVDRYSGAANKNIGDAFLLVWKIENEDLIRDKKTDELMVKQCSRVSQLADMSVISFILLIAGLKKSRKMVKYNEHKGLNERLGQDYQVKLGLGLHMGYSIEGAIGSYYKIDASYLSPHVNMAMRLEGATKKFGVPLLISGQLYSRFTRKTRSYCRQMDYCTMAGNDEPVKLYTIDVDATNIPLEDDDTYATAKQKKIKRVQDRVKRNNLRDAAFSNQIEISSQFTTNQELVIMRKNFTKSFMKTYEESFNAYVKGDWVTAKIGFEKVLEMKSDDKPT